MYPHQRQPATPPHPRFVFPRHTVRGLSASSRRPIQPVVGLAWSRGRRQEEEPAQRLFLVWRIADNTRRLHRGLVAWDRERMEEDLPEEEEAAAPAEWILVHDGLRLAACLHFIMAVWEEMLGGGEVHGYGLPGDE